MIPPVAFLPPVSAAMQAASGGSAAVNATGRPSVVVVTSQQLFGGAQEVQIEHHGALYRLKQTSLGKLILTK